VVHYPAGSSHPADGSLTQSEHLFVT